MLRDISVWTCPMGYDTWSAKLRLAMWNAAALVGALLAGLVTSGTCGCGETARADVAESSASTGGASASHDSNSASASPSSATASSAGGSTEMSGAVATTGAAGSGAAYVGLDCGQDVCEVGERCYYCRNDEPGYLCAPRPDLDSAGFAGVTADCEGLTELQGRDCDGPEDCLPGEYCSATTARCSETPTVAPTNCCFYCNAPPYCDYCRVDSDCPAGAECNRGFALDHDLGACLAARCAGETDCPASTGCYQPDPSEPGWCFTRCSERTPECTCDGEFCLPRGG